jgi:hypothetical protein
VRFEPQDSSWSMADAERLGVAISQLACFALDELWQDDQFDGCCPRCCAACTGLATLLTLGILDRVVEFHHTGFEQDSAWWLDSRMVDRKFLASAWRMTTCHEDLTERHSTDTQG